jgi:uncharacterized membrane protein YecN with MAPEG domain
MTIVPAYSALFALLFLVLSARTIQARRSAQIAIGTRGDKMLERRPMDTQGATAFAVGLILGGLPALPRP